MSGSRGVVSKRQDSWGLAPALGIGSRTSSRGARVSGHLGSSPSPALGGAWESGRLGSLCIILGKSLPRSMSQFPLCLWGCYLLPSTVEFRPRCSKLEGVCQAQLCVPPLPPRPSHTPSRHGGRGAKALNRGIGWGRLCNVDTGPALACAEPPETHSMQGRGGSDQPGRASEPGTWPGFEPATQRQPVPYPAPLS